MHIRLLFLTVLALFFAMAQAPAATTRYVNAGNTNPIVPYTSWSTAATNIQDAANFTGFGDMILVTNGIYQYGGSSIGGSNRVYIGSSATVQSVNGPAVTTIVGYQMPGVTNGSGAVRCVYLNAGAVLSGFTLTNGATQTSGAPNIYGGGVYCALASCVVTNCVITGNAAYSSGGGAYAGALWNCTLSGNVAASAGGAYQAALNNCVLTGNRAISNGGSGGGGAASSTLTNCVISANSAAYPGGGVTGGTLVNCIVASNSAPTAAGVTSVTAYDCLFYGNTNGYAAYIATLYNCTVAQNYSPGSGAVASSTLINSIIYNNSNSIYADCYQCKLTNCCTALLGNNVTTVNTLTNPPAFLDMAHGDYHLQIGSPGMDAGTNVFPTGTTDLDGNPRIVNGTVDMGAYEIQNTNPVHYVNLVCTNPVAPFTNWLTAATNIQTAVAAALAGDFVVVSNGLYKAGGGIMSGTESNRVVLTNAITLVGLYGPSATVIVGSLGVNNTRCAYVGSNSVLYGFTLANGTTVGSGDTIKEQSGGGAWCEKGGVISNCVVGGTAFPYANNGSPNDTCTAIQQGGGVYGGKVYNSTLANNTAGTLGGGAAAAATLINCLVLTNSSSGGYAGGLYQGAATNCTFNGNTAGDPISGRAGGAYQSTLSNCTFNRNTGAVGGTGFCTNYNCTFINNGGDTGGGLYGGISYSCVIVSNTASAGGGAYQSTMYGCLVISNRATANTGGGGVYQCTVYNSTVSTNTAGLGYGGGAAGGSLFNCILSGNYGGGAINSTLYGCQLTGNTNTYGGGSVNSTLVNCLLNGNYAMNVGGGAYEGTLRNCTVVSNSATQVGGVSLANVYNSIVYYNSSAFGVFTNYSGGSFNYCDTFPSPGGFGSITNDPGLVNPAGGDFHLQNNSACINSGNNAYVVTNIDLAGNPRIAGGTVDIGAYEYQTPTSVISYAYLQMYGLPTDGSADYVDTDGDGMNTYQEWKTGTIPTDPNSVLKMLLLTNSVAGVIVTWQSVTNVTYFVQRSTNLVVKPPFSTIQSNLFGVTGLTSYLDTTATNSPNYFYRVGVP